MQLLKFLGLMQEFVVPQSCSKSEFLTALKHNVSDRNYEPFEDYKSGASFKGRVDGEEFELRRRRDEYYYKANEVTIDGIVSENKTNTVIYIQATAFYGYYILIFSALIPAGLIYYLIENDNSFLIGTVVLAINVFINGFPMARAVSHAREHLFDDFTAMVADYKRRKPSQ